MGRKKQELPSLANATPPFLVDELGKIRDQIKKLQKDEGFIKAALTARLQDGENHVIGEEYEMNRISTTQHRFDKEKAREMLSAEDFEACHTDISFEQIRTKRME